jgi:hypothetical protein
MSFQKGDRIRVKENGFMGTIHAVSYNSIYADNEYYLLWDNFPGKGLCPYLAADVQSTWEKVDDADAGAGYVNQDPDAVTIQLPNPPANGYTYHVYRGNTRIDPIETKKECEHKWVEVGFMHTKTVCYHCDVEKK